MTSLRIVDFSSFVSTYIGKEGRVKKAQLSKMTCIALAFCIAMATASPAQTPSTVATFNTLVTFNGTNGGTPLGQLLQATDGELYGTTEFAGTCGNGSAGGTVFKVTTSGAMTVLHDFCQGDIHGYDPVAGLVQASNGMLFGTTTAGGANGTGGVFELTPSESLSTVGSFTTADGLYPSFSLTEGTDGNLYGSTEGNYGGSTGNNGIVFKMSLAGKLTTLYSFDGANGSGIGPLVQGTNGNLYGLAGSGGQNGDSGTIFTLSTSGALATLYNFCSQTNCTDGLLPFGFLLGSDGNFYGTTLGGGNANAGVFFKITPSGHFSTIHSFCSASGCPDGSTPTLFVQGSDGNFYGTTAAGGAYNYGTIYRLTTSGVLTRLHSFCAQSGCPDGANPIGIIQDTNGTFYGIASSGGSTSYPCDDALNGGTAPGCGTVFSLSTGLTSFVQARLTMGKVDSKITLLGNNLAGATAVSFNGTPATFAVASPGQILATVPNGATTGRIQVTTPGATFKSNGPFWVTPQLKSISPPSGSVGTTVTIAGVSLTQTSSVTFNGVATTQFTVNSDTEVTATVPPGAVTGKITITTAGGTATSEASFNLTNGTQTH